MFIKVTFDLALKGWKGVFQKSKREQVPLSMKDETEAWPLQDFRWLHPEEKRQSRRETRKGQPGAVAVGGHKGRAQRASRRKEGDPACQGGWGEGKNERGAAAHCAVGWSGWTPFSERKICYHVLEKHTTAMKPHQVTQGQGHCTGRRVDALGRMRAAGAVTNVPFLDQGSS